MAIEIMLLAVMIVAEGPKPDFVTTQAAADVKYVADAGGRRLYTFQGDGVGYDCTGDCLTAWPPVVARPEDKPAGDWKPVKRPAGLLQWAYMGHPVYTYSYEIGGGGTSAGLPLGWQALEYEIKLPVIAVPPAAAVASRDQGFVLTDYRGNTLYTFAQDGHIPTCKGECLEVWPPLLAPALAAPIGDWKPVDRPDGVRQWSYRGKLVYTYSDDLDPKDARGANAGGLWKIVTVRGDADRSSVASKAAVRVADSRRP